MRVVEVSVTCSAHVVVLNMIPIRLIREKDLGASIAGCTTTAMPLDVPCEIVPRVGIKAASLAGSVSVRVFDVLFQTFVTPKPPLASVAIAIYELA